MSVLKLNEPYHFPFGKLSPLSHDFNLPLQKHRESRIDYTTKYAKSIAAYVYAGLLKHNYVILESDENDIFKIFKKSFQDQLGEEFKQDLLYYINETYTKGPGDAMRRSLVTTGNSPIHTNDKLFYPISNYASSQWLSNVMITLRNRIREENKISDELENKEKQQNYLKKIRAVHDALQRKASDGQSLEKYFNKKIDELYSLLYFNTSLPVGDFTKENVLMELKDKENEQYIKFIIDNPFYDGMIALCVHNHYFNKDKFDQNNLYTVRRAFLRSLKNNGTLTTEEMREFLNNYVDESFDQRLFYFYQLGEITIPSDLMINTSKPMKKGEMTFQQIKDAYEKHQEKNDNKIDVRSPPHSISSRDDLHSIFYGDQNSIAVKAFKRMFSRLGISLGSINTNEMDKIYKDSIHQYLREKIDKRVKEAIRLAFKKDDYLLRLLVSTIDAKFSKHSTSYSRIEYDNDDSLLGTGDDSGDSGLNLYGNALMEYRDILMKANVRPLEHYEYVFPPRKSKMKDVFTHEEEPFMMRKIDEMIMMMSSFHKYQNKVLNQSNDIKIEECYFVRNLLMTCVECIKGVEIPPSSEMPDDFSDYIRQKGLRIPKKGVSYLWEYISSTHQILRLLNINPERYGEILRKFEAYSAQRAKESMQIPPLNKFLDGSSTDVNYKNHIANAVINIIVASKKYFKTFYEKAYTYQVLNEDVEFAFRVFTSTINDDVPIMIDNDSYYTSQRFMSQFIDGAVSSDVALLFKNVVNSLSHLDVFKQIKRFQSCEAMKKIEDSIDMFEDESRDIVIEGDVLEDEENLLDKLIEDDEDNLIIKHYKESKDEDEEENKHDDEDEDFAEEDDEGNDGNDGFDYDQQFSDDEEY